MSEFNPGLMLELIEAERCEASLLVPTMILAILDHPDRAKRDCSSLRTIVSGAANVPAALVRRVHETLRSNVCIIFGQTESNGPITITAPTDLIEDQTGTVGRPLAHVAVKIVEPASEVIVPIETVGEIWVRGYQTMTGYYGQPEASLATIRPDGWLRTGDLGTMDARGYLKITGRLKDMIIRGGMNLYPKEIEDVLFDHPSVSQIAVVGIPDEKWGEIVAAVVMSKNPEKPPTADELYAYCRANLSPQKAPERWFFVRQYPLTSTQDPKKRPARVDQAEQDRSRKLAAAAEQVGNGLRRHRRPALLRGGESHEKSSRSTTGGAGHGRGRRLGRCDCAIVGAERL